MIGDAVGLAQPDELRARRRTLNDTDIVSHHSMLQKMTRAGARRSVDPPEIAPLTTDRPWSGQRPSQEGPRLLARSTASSTSPDGAGTATACEAVDVPDRHQPHSDHQLAAGSGVRAWPPAMPTTSASSRTPPRVRHRDKIGPTGYRSLVGRYLPVLPTIGLSNEGQRPRFGDTLSSPCSGSNRPQVRVVRSDLDSCSLRPLSRPSGYVVELCFEQTCESLNVTRLDSRGQASGTWHHVVAQYVAKHGDPWRADATAMSMSSPDGTGHPKGWRQPRSPGDVAAGNGQPACRLNGGYSSVSRPV